LDRNRNANISRYGDFGRVRENLGKVSKVQVIGSGPIIIGQAVLKYDQLCD
jgi:hypothetical protein